MKTKQLFRRKVANPFANTSTLQPRIAIAYRPISDVKLDPRNPRAHSRRQIRQIARSIKTFGFIVPVLVDRLLAEQLNALSLANIDFDIEATGFDMGEIDFRIQGLEADTAEPDADDGLPADAGPPVTKPGDLWQLGRHRIYCGNALDEGSFATLMNGKR